MRSSAAEEALLLSEERREVGVQLGGKLTIRAV
jgi:hypothetical protein